MYAVPLYIIDASAQSCLAYIDALSFSLVSLMLADARPLSALNYIIRDLIYRYTLLRLPEQQHCDVCCTLIAFAGSGKQAVVHRCATGPA